MPSVGVRPDGTLAWIDANGNEVNPDGSAIPGAQQLRPLTSPTNTTPGQAQPTPTTQPSTNVDIAPAGSGAAPVTNQQQGPPSPGTGTTPQTAPSVGQPQGPGGMFTVDQTTQSAAQEVQAANVDVAKIWGQVNDAKGQVDKLQAAVQGGDITQQNALTAATSNLNTLYSTLSQAEQRVETANASYSTALGKAIDQNLVTPGQVELAKSQAAKADADAATAKAQAQVLTDGAPGQRALVAAQAGQASASAAAQQATADATKAKTPAEISQLNAQAASLNAQAQQTATLTPSLKAKADAEVGLTQAQTDLTGSQSDLAKAQAGQAGANTSLLNAQAALTTARIPGETGLLGAQTQLAGAQAGLAGAQGTAQLAGAAGALADIQQKQLGPLYGLSDQINAIKAIQQQVFGPGGSGDPSEADDLLKQYTTAAISGTTPYAASVAAANAGLTQFGTQASMFNAAQQALASRANALTGLGGSVLGTLAGINANAPAGSTAMAGAFKDVVDYMANKIAAQQGAATGQPGAMQQPTAPALPPLLQRLAGVGGGTPAAGLPMPTGGAPGTPFSSGAVSGAPPSTVAPASSGQGQGVQINVSTGGSQTATSTPSPPPGGYAQNQPGTYGALSGSMPSMLQSYAPPTPDFVHQLWGNELQSGAVQSPFTPQVPPVPSPMGM